MDSWHRSQKTLYVLLKSLSSEYFQDNETFNACLITFYILMLKLSKLDGEASLIAEPFLMQIHQKATLLLLLN